MISNSRAPFSARRERRHGGEHPRPSIRRHSGVWNRFNRTQRFRGQGLSARRGTLPGSRQVPPPLHHSLQLPGGWRLWGGSARVGQSATDFARHPLCPSHSRLSITSRNCESQAHRLRQNRHQTPKPARTQKHARSPRRRHVLRCAGRLVTDPGGSTQWSTSTWRKEAGI